MTVERNKEETGKDKEKEDKIEIIPEKEDHKFASKKEFFGILKMVAPGTHLRTALDGALKTGNGALIVVENKKLFPLLDGGFRVNCKFTPQRLVELVKMDGAIILSENLKRIDLANVLLTPSSKIRTSETGRSHIHLSAPFTGIHP